MYFVWLRLTLPSAPLFRRSHPSRVTSWKQLLCVSKSCARRTVTTKGPSDSSHIEREWGTDQVQTELWHRMSQLFFFGFLWMRDDIYPFLPFFLTPLFLQILKPSWSNLQLSFRYRAAWPWSHGSGQRGSAAKSYSDYDICSWQWHDMLFLLRSSLLPGFVVGNLAIKPIILPKLAYRRYLSVWSIKSTHSFMLSWSEHRLFSYKKGMVWWSPPP